MMSRTIRLCIAALSFAVTLLIAANIYTIPGTYTLKTLSKSQIKERYYKKHNWPEGVLEITGIDNLHSELFPEGFQIEVKNISGKPIYHININVLLPDAREYLNGNIGGFNLKFGSTRLVTIGSMAEPLDDKINPGEKYLLKVNESTSKNFFTFSENKDLIRAKGTWHIVLDMQHVSFGDGSGYQAGSEYSLGKIGLERGMNKSEYMGIGYLGFFNLLNDKLLKDLSSLGAPILTLFCPYQNCGKWKVTTIEDCGFGCSVDQITQAGFPDIPCQIVCFFSSSCGCINTRLDPCTPDPPLCCCIS